MKRKQEQKKQRKKDRDEETAIGEKGKKSTGKSDAVQETTIMKSYIK